MEEQRGRASRRVLAVAAMTFGAMVTLGSAQAAPPEVSYLQASPTGVTVDVNPAAVSPAHSANVVVGLDSNCPNAVAHGQSYGIAPDVSPYVSVSPASVSGLKCGQTATFAISGVAATPTGGIDLPFNPVNSAPGQQRKLGGTTVHVVVIDTTGGGCTTDCPTASGRPAAPAVANAYLGDDPGLVSACKATFGAKAWRGTVISKVADWMPKPESIKDDTTVFPEDSDWIIYVQTAVNGLCNYVV